MMVTSTVHSTTWYYHHQNTSVVNATTRAPGGGGGSGGAASVGQVMGFVYFYLTAGMSVVSIAACVFMFVVFVMFRPLMTPARKMLLYLTFVDLLTAVGNLTGVVWYFVRARMSERGRMTLCRAHAALTFFSTISSFFWTMAIALHLHLCIVQNRPRLAERMMIPYHVVCWCLPAFIAILSLCMNVIGYVKNMPVPSWCWINPDVSHSMFWTYFTGKMWELLSYAVILVLYGHIKCFLYQQIRKTKDMHAKPDGKKHSSVLVDANRKLTFVPVVYFFCRIWGTVRFMVGAHAPDMRDKDNVHWIAPLQGIGDSAQGFANTILFCLFTKHIKDHLTVCCTTCNCQVHREVAPSSDSTQHSRVKSKTGS